MDASETAEETDVNPDQLRVSLEFEKRAKPTDGSRGLRRHNSYCIPLWTTGPT